MTTGMIFPPSSRMRRKFAGNHSRWPVCLLVWARGNNWAARCLQSRSWSSRWRPLPSAPQARPLGGIPSASACSSTPALSKGARLTSSSRSSDFGTGGSSGTAPGMASSARRTFPSHGPNESIGRSAGGGAAPKNCYRNLTERRTPAVAAVSVPTTRPRASSRRSTSARCRGSSPYGARSRSMVMRCGPRLPGSRPLRCTTAGVAISSKRCGSVAGRLGTDLVDLRELGSAAKRYGQGLPPSLLAKDRPTNFRDRFAAVFASRVGD